MMVDVDVDVDVAVDDVTNKLLDDALEEKRRCQYSSSASCDDDDDGGGGIGGGETSKYHVAGQISTLCVNRLRRRMELDPSLRYLDAVRMIGLNVVNDIVGDEDDIENSDNNDHGTFSRSHHPSFAPSSSSSSSSELYLDVNEIDDQGLFETETSRDRRAQAEEPAMLDDDDDDDDDVSYYQPTTKALQFGRQVQQLFLQHDYKYQTC
eukprot:CAMPEP_0113481194 /NCGR_PEP_ID=MMETSP0014_2-20120614/22282_1 /TAXON_ID=2857 /ORGANISM="Nitzschia sp." /LENGTH=207 /DNA_ID=CAMNT_0000374681 /DNA_START=56 /DNA_END=677 /DNA_ORIENTATION=+ /assembly_acc=CAM_ASM_000159